MTTALQRRAMGLGDPAPDPTLDWEYVLGGGDEPTYSTPVFNSTRPVVRTPGFIDTWLGPLLAGAEKTVSNIFAPAATSIAQAQPAVGYQYQAQPAAYRNPTNTGVGFGIDGNGIRLSDGSHIGWVPIFLVGFGFVLIQSRPFTRR
jgi:hypothetical protein